MLIYAGTKAIKPESIGKHVKDAGHQLIVQNLLNMTVPVGKSAEIAGFLDVENGEFIKFAVRTKKAHPEIEGEIKWGTPRGEHLLTFETLEETHRLMRPNKEERNAFRPAIRDLLLATLRERLQEIEPEVRDLKLILAKKDKPEAEEAPRRPRSVGVGKTNCPSNPKEQSTAA